MKVCRPCLFTLLAGFLLLTGCNPYVGQIQQLDRAYAAGQVDTKTYDYTRQQLVQQNIAYCQQQAASSAAMAAALNASRPIYTQPVYVAPPVQQTIYVGGGLQPVGYYPYFH
jgi:hypothetical protein